MQTPTLDQLKRALHISEAIEKLQAELGAIFGKVSHKALRMADSGIKRATVKVRKLSKAARANIAEAQKRRWAKGKGKTSKPAGAAKEKSAKKGGKMSAAGRAAIVAAQKLRWAKVRADKEKKS